MGGIAAIAREAGYHVSGCDANVYPPMSEQLAGLGIDLIEGFGPEQLSIKPDLWVIGNVVSRGNPLMEAILDAGQRYVSGPQWLYEHVLCHRHVLAVAGTHGKTTTTAMLTHILNEAGLSPGYLVGGVPGSAVAGARSAVAGTGEHFVIEADEYDTAFFDKRAKFVHYRPRVAILNNLEYDHADIYPDLDAIKTQFHHLVRTIPGEGTILCNGADAHLETVLRQGCWSRLERFSADESADWRVRQLDPDGSRLGFARGGEPIAEVSWSHCGEHNALNACAAVGAAVAVGVDPQTAVAALAEFAGVKRRLEGLGKFADVHVYDDFAHHPTAIRMTLSGLRRRVGNARILVGLEPRSNTMRAGVHADRLGPSLIAADRVWLMTGDDIDWDPQVALAPLEGRGRVVTRTGEMLQQMLDEARPGDHVVFMSNGGFDAAPRRFIKALDGGTLEAQAPPSSSS